MRYAIPTLERNMMEAQIALKHTINDQFGQHPFATLHTFKKLNVNYIFVNTCIASVYELLISPYVGGL